CWSAVEVYEKRGCRFVLSAQKTPTGRTVADSAMDGLAAYRRRRPVRLPLSAGRMGKSLSLRCLAISKKALPKEDGGPEQYQLFDTPAAYAYRVLVTNVKAPH